MMATDRVYISSIQMNPIHLILLYYEVRFGPLRNLEPCRLYRIVHIHMIFIAKIVWFLIHIREDPSDTLSDLYVEFRVGVLFSTNLEFVINHQLIIAHLIYYGDVWRLKFAVGCRI